MVDAMGIKGIISAQNEANTLLNLSNDAMQTQLEMCRESSQHKREFGTLRIKISLAHVLDIAEDREYLRLRVFKPLPRRMNRRLRINAEVRQVRIMITAVRLCLSTDPVPMMKQTK
jgi:hypothetical protein